MLHSRSETILSIVESWERNKVKMIVPAEKSEPRMKVTIAVSQ